MLASPFVSKSLYINLSEINGLQTDIMRFVAEWVRTKKTPVPQKEIILEMSRRGVKTFTTVNALNSLLRKRFIRRETYPSNKTRYIMCRSI